MKSIPQNPKSAAIERELRLAMVYPLETLALTMIAVGVVIFDVLPHLR